jgi:sirohydrochlorin cobaltochelatase
MTQTTADTGLSLPPSARHGLILFGHGARDPRWAEPFERLAAKLTERVAQEATAATHAAGPEASDTAAGRVSLAYLELMTPDLATAITNHVAAGCTVITVIPVFFGVGAHLRRDFPALLAACRTAHPGIDIRAAQAVGEDDGVLNALSEYAHRQWLAPADTPR